MPPDQAERQALSSLLFRARENLSMFADFVANRGSGQPQELERIIAEIDTYRAAQGWDPDGFGKEK
jgi:hypothetical protein